MTTPTQPPAHPAPPETPTPATDLAVFEGLVDALENAVADLFRKSTGLTEANEARLAARAALLAAHREALEQADRLAGALRGVIAAGEGRSGGRWDVGRTALRAYDEAKKGGTTP